MERPLNFSPVSTNSIEISHQADGKRRTSNLLPRLVLIGGTSIGVVLAWACQDGSNLGVQNEPTNVERSTETLSTVVRADTPTLVPTLTATLEPKPRETEESRLTLEQLNEVVNRALDTIPESMDVLNVRNAMDDANKGYEGVMKGQVFEQIPISDYGNAARFLDSIVCENPNNEDLANAWNALRDFTLGFIADLQAEGKLRADADATYESLYFTSTCNDVN